MAERSLASRRAAAWPTLKDDLGKAGAVHVGDAPTAEDRNPVTARHPGDVPELNRALPRHFAEGGGAGRAVA